VWRGAAWRGHCRSCVQSAIACARFLGRLACSVVCCTGQALGENRTLKHCDLSANRLGDQTIASLLTCCGPNRMRCAAADSNGTAQGCDGCRTCCMVYVACCMLYAVCCMLYAVSSALHCADEWSYVRVVCAAWPHGPLPPCDPARHSAILCERESTKRV
jgi:hypothetical protein